MATFTFICPYCKTEIEADKEWIGMTSECPVCNNEILITDGKTTGTKSVPDAHEGVSSTTGSSQATQSSAGQTSEDSVNPPVQEKPKITNLFPTAKGALNFKKKMLRKQIYNMQDLPTLPANVIAILNLLKDENVDFDKVIYAMEKDQVIVARILRLINSGYYGLRSEVTSLKYAVNLLGFLQIKELLYATSMMDMLSGSDAIIWLHAFSSQCPIRDIIRKEKLKDVQQNLPLTMLMHDIGQVVLQKFNPNSYKIARKHALDNKMPIYKAEEQFLNVSHAEVGGWLMEKWDMTEETIVPIAFHHSDEIPEGYITETALVQIADWIDGHVRDLPVSQPCPDLIKQAGLDSLNLMAIEESHARNIENIDAANPALKK